MRLLFILICSIALVCFAPGVEAGKKKDKKQAQSSAVSKKDKHGKAKSAEWSKSKGAGKPNKGNSWNNQKHQKHSKKGKSWSSANNEWAGGQSYKYKSKTKVKTKHYSLSYKHNPTIQNVKFQKSYRIRGAEHWHGARYAAFRNYHPEWHDQSWWRTRYNRVVFISGGWYYWNAGWWYPAWGYAPNAYYAYDGPIYAYNNLPPDQVIANVQAVLQEQGYYQGDVDGLLGPLTRAAIANYQRANGLAETTAVDEPTLESLGIT